MDWSFLQHLLDTIRIEDGNIIRVLDHGYVKFLNVMPATCPPGQTRDYIIVDAARVSTGGNSVSAEKDYELIMFLLRNRHTSPFEQAELQLEMYMPLFVAGQWLRHRTANANVSSQRYGKANDCFYTPTDVTTQSSSNKQCASSDPIVDDEIRRLFYDTVEKSQSIHNTYEKLVDNGVARETARIVLPTSIYTKIYWKCDLHNIMHMLSLRMKPDAQMETRQFANAVFKFVHTYFPVSTEAFMKYIACAITLSVTEIKSIAERKDLFKNKNSSEYRSFIEKLKRLNLLELFKEEEENEKKINTK